MKGIVYIIGQIGNTYAQDGSIETKGVTVADVAVQFAAQSDCEAFDVVINSPGGSVNVGDEISDMLAGMANVFTIASGQCMSIATKIFTSVPLAKRSIESNCQFMIHSPLFANISGNAAELKHAAGVLEPIEKDLTNHYVKATGLTKNILSPLMNAESFLSPEDCVTLGFAGQIIEPKLKAVAFYDANFNKTNMSEVNTFAAKVKSAAVALGIIKPDGAPADPQNGGEGGSGGGADGRNAVALVLESDNGVIETPYDDIMVGDAVIMQETGEPAADGAYTLPDGMVINVLDGMVESVIPVEGGDLQAVIVAKDAEIAELKATIVALEETQETAALVIEKLEAKALRSTHKPGSGAQASFRPVAGVQAKKPQITKESIVARRAELAGK